MFALAAVANFTGAGPTWNRALMVASHMPLRAALPVHWLGFGCGGAVVGFWMGCRFREGPEEAQESEEAGPQ
ncbi:hypothetical protein LCGC14_2258000 [marine sediment metagenome]|uniref:Uncharacterized protein n=1 Tax=marine sediment metagenome TaxID=412755 RepID=A0A0F9FVK8_9ZZZZ